MLKKWQILFSTNQKKGQSFLDFEDEKQYIIVPIYAKGDFWLPSIGFTNALCAWFTCITTGHALIDKYCQQFFSNTSLNWLCG